MKVIKLEKMSYNEAWKIQEYLFQKRQKNEIADTLLLVEHPPTITLGVNKKWNQLKVKKEELTQRGIDFHYSKRGGGSAYLGPGQLVGYTIMDIKPFGGILNFMRMLEEVMIQTAQSFEIEVNRYDTMNPTTNKPYRATWYRSNGKSYVLCTKGIGTRVSSKGLYTHHGFCLNVNQNNSYFDLIDPCGFPVSEIRPISMQEIIGKEVDMEKVKEVVSDHFKDIFFKYESPQFS